jgi:hypothetical protein
MHYIAGRIVVKALNGEVVVDRTIDAELFGESGLALHPTLGTGSADGEVPPNPQELLYTITHISTGCALGTRSIRGETFAREALERIAGLAEEYPDGIRWTEDRPFASPEIARLAGRLIHWIVVDCAARSTLASRQARLPTDNPHR